LGKVALMDGNEGPKMLDDLFNQLHDHSPDLVCQTMGSLLEICKARELDSGTKGNLETVISRKINNSDYRIRALSLGILSYISSNQLIAEGLKDSDARVRKSGIEALLTLSSRGTKLDLSLYEIAVTSLIDEVEDVRFEAIELISVISHLYARFKVATIGHEGYKMKLIDDAFVKICDMVNDPSVRVRTKACETLGSFAGIDSKFLMQTLSKQIMSNLKFRSSYAEQEKETQGYQIAKPGSSRKLLSSSLYSQASSNSNPEKGVGSTAIFSPEGDTDVTYEEISLLETGACGAFVHGLEDEYQEVRDATITSICELGLRSADFAASSIDFLVDMLNDEIDLVRINAIESLRKVGVEKGLDLKEDQLQITLSNLEDASIQIRTALHDLLGSIRFCNINCINLAAQSLLENMKRYPQDKFSIFKAFKGIGEHHANLIEFMVEGLLRLDNKFLTHEPNVEDLLYNCYLILIFNASVFNGTILSLLPKHSFNHYLYLRNLYPEMFQNAFPKLMQNVTRMGLLEENLTKEFEEGSHNIQVPSGSDDNAISYFTELMNQINLISLFAKKKDLKNTSHWIKSANSNAQHLGSIYPQLRTKMDYISLFLKNYGLLIEVKELFGQGQILSGIKLANQFTFNSYEMEHLYTFSEKPLTSDNSNENLQRRQRICAKQFRILGHVIWAISKFFKEGSAQGANSFKGDSVGLMAYQLCLRIQNFMMDCSGEKMECEILSKLAQDFSQISPKNPFNLNSNASVSSEMPSTSNSASKPASKMTSIILLDFIDNFIPLDIPDLLNLIVEKSMATITSPLPNPEKPLELLYTLPHKIDLVGTCENIQDLKSISIQVTLPDKSIQRFWPPEADFSKATLAPENTCKYLMNSQIFIRIPNPWTDACGIEIRICKTIDCDGNTPDIHLLNQSENVSGNSFLNSDSSFFPLSSPLICHINPKRAH